MMNRKSKQEEDGLQSLGDHVPSDIKDWLVAQEKDTRHPVQKMVERESARGRDVLHMDEGGIVPIDPYAGIPPAAQPMTLEDVRPPKPPVVPAPPAPAPVSAAPARPEADYNAEADQILGTSPEKRQQLFEATREPRAVNVLSTLGAGLGDAIARSYGQDSGAHHEENLQGILSEKNKSLLENEKEKAAMGKERYGLEQNLEAKDPNSAFSKVMQQGYRGILKKMGATDREVSSLPATAINDVVGQRVSLEKALAEVAASTNYRNASLDLARETAGSNIIHQRAEEAHTKTQEQIENEKQREEAAKVLAGRSLPQRISDKVFGNPGTEVLKGQLSKPTDSSAPSNAGPLGPMTVRDGKTYEWSPTTGKYHLKK